MRLVRIALLGVLGMLVWLPAARAATAARAPATARAATSAANVSTPTDGSRLRLAELVATGPLTHATLEFGSAGRATLELDLIAGETRHLVVPLPTREGFDASVPVSSDERLRFVDWAADAERERAFAALPLGLRARPAPPAPGRANAPSLAALLLAIAAACCLPRLRTRPWLAFVFGLVAAGAVLALELARARPAAARVVVDFDVGESACIRWRSAHDELELGDRTPLWLAVVPDEAPLDVRIDARGDRAVRTVVAARGAVLARADASSGAPSETPPAPDGNRWGELAEVWTRDADGAWTGHGAWAVGTALPEALAGDRRPPGWVNPALPQGRRLLIGRAAAQDDGAEVWIRVVGP